MKREEKLDRKQLADIWLQLMECELVYKYLGNDDAVKLQREQVEIREAARGISAVV